MGILSSFVIGGGETAIGDIRPPFGQTLPSLPVGWSPGFSRRHEIAADTK
jgi:hypothetical protein